MIIVRQAQFNPVILGGEECRCLGGRGKHLPRNWQYAAAAAHWHSHVIWWRWRLHKPNHILPTVQSLGRYCYSLYFTHLNCDSLDPCDALLKLPLPTPTVVFQSPAGIFDRFNIHLYFYSCLVSSQCDSRLCKLTSTPNLLPVGWRLMLTACWHTLYIFSSSLLGYEPMKGDWVQAKYVINPTQWTTQAHSVAPLRYCRLDQVIASLKVLGYASFV